MVSVCWDRLIYGCLWPGCYINVRPCGGPSMVPPQLKGPLELFVKKRELRYTLTYGGLCLITVCLWFLDVCALPADAGSCELSHTRWYYDRLTGQCKQFIYGGCQGNANRYESREACEASCPVKGTYLTQSGHKIRWFFSRDFYCIFKNNLKVFFIYF